MVRASIGVRARPRGYRVGAGLANCINCVNCFNAIWLLDQYI